MTEKWTPDDEERLRRALEQEAAKVYPSPGGLERILDRTRQSRWSVAWRNPALLGAAVAAATAVAAIGIGTGVLRDPSDNVLGPGEAPTASSPVATSEPASPTSEPTQNTTDTPIMSEPATDEPSRPPVTQAPEPGFVGAVPVYFVNDTRAGLRLAREWIPVDTPRNAIEEAVTRMIAKPPVPRYDTLWNPATQVRSVEVRDGAINVDLEASGTPIIRGEPEIAIQQLVYTATAAASLVDRDYGSMPVRIFVDGEPVDELGGVDVSEALRRAAPLDVRQLVQLNEPSQGATVSSPVRVSGDAAVFEATLVWELRKDGRVVDSGFDNTREGQRFSEFDFELELEPGEYTIVITEDDPSDGEGGEPMTDERTFTVVE
jgi:spore germination protein GerM